MITLLQSYSLSDILIIIILLALALKSLTSFFDWGFDRLNKIFNKKYKKVNEKQLLEQRLQHGSDIMNKLTDNQKETDLILSQLSKNIDMLIQSDKDAIKAYITERHHHFCYQVGWIDDYSLDCIEKRFKHYEDEGGNSFIGNFMNELRALPKQEQELTD